MSGKEPANSERTCSFEEIYTASIPTLITISSICDSEVGLLQASVSSSVETVGLGLVVHTAPIVAEEPSSIDAIESINIETKDMDPTGNCGFVAEDNMLI